MAREQLEALLTHAIRVQERSQLLLRVQPTYRFAEQSELVVINAYLKVFAQASDQDKVDPETPAPPRHCR
jgi:hypothetical protein